MLILNSLNGIDFKFEALDVIIFNAKKPRDEISDSIKGCYYSYWMALGMTNDWTMNGFKKWHNV
jgi:hypothetical protein